MNTTYDRFKRVFKKKEQICVYGMDWSSYGYITAIEPDGVTLTQLRRVNGIKYPWNCFEVVAHAGYKVHKSKETEVANIFRFKLSTHLPKAGEMPKKVKSTQYIERINKEKQRESLLLSSDVLFKAKEIIPGLNGRCRTLRFGSYPFPDIGEVYFDVIVGESEKSEMEVRITNHTQVHLYMPLSTEIISPLHARLHCNFSKSLCFRKEGYDDIYVSSGKDLPTLRRNKWAKSTYAGGDPVIFDGVPVGYKTWKSNDGFLLANHHADIYLGTYGFGEPSDL